MKAQAIFEVSLILALLVGAFIAGAIVALIQDRKRLRRMHEDDLESRKAGRGTW